MQQPVPQVGMPNGAQGGAMPIPSPAPGLPADSGMPVGMAGAPPMQFGTISFGTIGVAAPGPDMKVSVPINMPPGQQQQGK